MTIALALVGCGRWGKKLLAAVSRHEAFRLVAVADPDPAARAWVREICGISGTFVESRELLRALRLDAAIVATPTNTHAAVTEILLAAGLDVLVEKPLARSARAAARLCELSLRHGNIGMVGHVLRFHAATLELVRSCHAGELGTLQRISAVRATQSGSPDALWTLGPHELATLTALDPSRVVSLDAARDGDSTVARLALASGLSARFSWSTRALAPLRRTVIHGTRGTATLDELDPLSGSDPLDAELDAFADAIATRTRPRADFVEGARVVQLLERIERALITPAARAELHG
ncbi:MAG: Gfo/Idh/MocA family oxidoreductase [Myxococcales bacterium]|nr:Gfo/Idh/MocA family oxidoreductase [Myxococcales bacterium]